MLLRLFFSVLILASAWEAFAQGTTAAQADSLLLYSYLVHPKVPYMPYITLRQGLGNSFTRFASHRTATVAFFGGSITYNPGWRNKTMGWLQERFPGTAFHFIAAGIPSLGSPAHAFRLQQDVLDSGKIDLLFVEAAVNDRGNGTDSLTQLRSLEGIVRHALNSNPSMDIILMSFADSLKNDDYDRGRTPPEVDNHEQVAERYRLPSINLAKEVHDKIRQGEFSWTRDFKNLHPSPFGQELYFATIRKLLETSYPYDSAPAPGRPAPLPSPLDGSNFDSGRYFPPDAATGSDWMVDKDWNPADGLPIQKRFTHVPVLQATRPGDTLTLNFTGTAVGIAVDGGPDAGTITWSVDGSAPRAVDLFTPWSAARHLPWYLVLGQGLEDKRHVLILKIEEKGNPGSKGSACRIYHFLVNQ